MKKLFPLIVFLAGCSWLWGRNPGMGIDLPEAPSMKNQIYSFTDSNKLSTPAVYVDFAAGLVVFGSGQSLRKHLTNNNFGHTFSAGLFGERSNGTSYPKSSPGIFLSGNLEKRLWPHLGLGTGLGLSGIMSKTEGYNSRYGDKIKLIQYTIAVIPSLKWTPKGRGVQLAAGLAFYWNQMSGKVYVSSIEKVNNATFGAYGALSGTIYTDKERDIRITLRYLQIGTIETPSYRITNYGEPILPVGQANLNSLVLGLSFCFKN